MHRFSSMAESKEEDSRLDWRLISLLGEEEVARRDKREALALGHEVGVARGSSFVGVAVARVPRPNGDPKWRLFPRCRTVGGDCWGNADKRSGVDSAGSNSPWMYWVLLGRNSWKPRLGVGDGWRIVSAADDDCTPDWARAAADGGGGVVGFCDDSDAARGLVPDDVGDDEQQRVWELRSSAVDQSWRRFLPMLLSFPTKRRESFF